MSGHDCHVEDEREDYGNIQTLNMDSLLSRASKESYSDKFPVFTLLPRVIWYPVKYYAACAAKKTSEPRLRHSR